MLVIFDCDGVLVDSEHLAAQVFSDVLRAIDVDMSPERCLVTFQGKTLPACYLWLEKEFSISLPELFDERLQKATQEAFEKFLAPVNGVQKVIEELKNKNIDICVASNGDHDKIEFSLSKVGLLSYFNMRFSAQDVSQGKPSPDLFLLAAKHFDVNPSDACVIEDSHTGWQAATAAGMHCIVYAPHGEPEFECETYCHSMNEVGQAVEAFLQLKRLNA